MRRLIVLLIGALLALSSARASAGDLGELGVWRPDSTAKIDHSTWKAFLDVYLDNSSGDGVVRLRYAAVSPNDKRRLANYIAMLAKTDPTALGKDEAFAYWVNLYNALTVKLILDHYPVKSIREIKPSLFALGPWGMPAVTVLGEELSLGDIENKILRAAWKDNRVHYALNCASIGCPDLQVFNGDNLDEELDAAAKRYVNSARGVHFDKRGRLVVSSIYKWYAADFGGSERSVIAHLAKYAEPALAERLRHTAHIAQYDYDWSLNDAK